MSDFSEKLRLKEAAEEDIYFAKRDRELIEALHEKKLSELAECGGAKKHAEDFEKRYRSISAKHKRKPRRLMRSIRALLDEIEKACRRRR